MAVYRFSALSDGQSISFNPSADVLHFDQSSIAAADIRVTVEGSHLRVAVGEVEKDVLLLNVSPFRLSTSSVTFADGSRLLFGDNSTALNDDASNSLGGTAGADYLSGFGGNDTLSGGAGDDRLDGGAGTDRLDGGLGNDSYVVTSGDVIVDSGGIDTVESSIGWTLGTGLENLTLTGTSGATAVGNGLNNLIIGNAGNNQISGRDGDDALYGGGGNDTFNMSNGAGASYGGDWIDGGSGVDTIDFGANARSAVTINLIDGNMSGGGTGGAGWANFTSIENAIGGAFNDYLLGSSAANVLFGGSGNDRLDGRQGNDRLEGGAGADQYAFTWGPGSADADTIIGFVSGTDKIVLSGSDHPAVGLGGNFAAGDDRFMAGPGFSSGREGSDRIVYDTSTGRLYYDADGFGPSAPQLIATLQGAPTLRATDIVVEGNNSIVGTEGDDSLTGTAANDTINGLGGNDTIHGVGGSDLLIGGAGNDLVRGGDNDGSGGDPGDRFIGGEGNDTLDGTQRHGSLSVDTMDGGSGNDVFHIDNSGDVLSDAGGVETVVAFDIDWTLGAGFEHLHINNDWGETANTGIGNELDNHMSLGWGGGRLEGRGGNDTLVGGTRSSTLVGGDGNDHLFGSYKDFLEGGAGDDILVGGFSASGGAGADDFVLIVSHVQINDFASAVDQLHLSDYFPNAGPAGNFAAADERFYAAPGANAAHDASDRVIYDTTTGSLYYDVDGTGATAPWLIANLQGAPSLSATDIVVMGRASGAAITGTDGNEDLWGTRGNDTMDARAGNDWMYGDNGDDSLVGGIGHDSVHGGFGADTVQGGAGNDFLSAEVDLADLLVAGDGDDTLLGGGSGTLMDGGAGNDMYHVPAGGVSLSDSGGVDTVVAYELDWTLGAGFEHLQINNHSAGERTGVGNELDNHMTLGWPGGRLEGRGGNDTLLAFSSSSRTAWLDGGDGNDSLRGWDGQDALWGGAGVDTLQGGQGADRFIFADPAGMANADRVSDFAGGIDRLYFQNGVFTALGAASSWSAGDDRFMAGAGFTAAQEGSDRLVYNTSTGDLYYDADGMGGTAAVLVATLQGAPALSASDITVF